MRQTSRPLGGPHVLAFAILGVDRVVAAPGPCLVVVEGVVGDHVDQMMSSPSTPKITSEPAVPMVAKPSTAVIVGAWP